MKAPAVNATVTVPGAYVLPLALIALTLANGFFNSIASAFGAAFPYDTFCFSAGDLLADFVKSAVSFPGPAIRSLDHWPPLYRDYVANNPYGGAAALAEGKLSNLHGMPLPTFILLEARRPVLLPRPLRPVQRRFRRLPSDRLHRAGGDIRAGWRQSSGGLAQR